MTVDNHTADTQGLSNQQASARSPARRLSGSPGGTGTFEVRSRTVPERCYLLTVTPERVYCTCPGFAFRNGCWHVGRIAGVLRLEMLALVDRQREAARRLEEIAEELDCG
jgi:hypothetical protein